MKTRRGIVLGLLVTGLVLLLALPATAQSPQIDDMIEGPGIQGDDAPTVAERHGVTSYRYPFHGDGVSIGSRGSEMLDQTLNAIASLLIVGAGLLAQAASRLVQWAFDPGTTAWLLDAVESTIDALGSSIYGQAVLLVIMLGAIWVAWQGIANRQATSSIQGAIWMIAVVAVGVAFFAQPRWFIEGPHNVTTELTAGLFGAVAGVGTDAGTDDYHGGEPPTFSGPAAIDAQRQLEDQLWHVMVYEPWRISTFPTPELADQYGEDLLAERSQENVEDIYDEIKAEDPEAAEFFAGREPLDRVVASGMTLLAAVPIAATMIVLGAALIVLQFAFVILSLLAPIFLLLGIHPGGGRNALLRWLDMWLGTLVKRVALTALISVLVSLFAFAAANLEQQGWYLTVLLTTLVCVAALVYRKAITELLASAAGGVGAGKEGEREHRARAHPVQTTVRTSASATRAMKFMGAGAMAHRAVRAGRTGPDDGAGQATGAGGSNGTGERRRRHGSRARPTGRSPAEGATAEDTGQVQPGNAGTRRRDDDRSGTTSREPTTEPNRRRPTGDRSGHGTADSPAGTDEHGPQAAPHTLGGATRDARRPRHPRHHQPVTTPRGTAPSESPERSDPPGHPPLRARFPRTPRRDRSRGER